MTSRRPRPARSGVPRTEARSRAAASSAVDLAFSARFPGAGSRAQAAADDQWRMPHRTTSGTSGRRRRPADSIPRADAVRGHRVRAMAARTAIGLLAAIGLPLLAGSAPAWAASTPTFYTNASPSTLVGLQVFDHTNLGGVSPTGTITFRLYGPGDTSCSSPVFTTTTTVSGTGSDDSSAYATRSAGTYNWIAAYSGDANNNPVSTPCGSPSQAVVVSKSMPVASVAAATAGGGAIHATATISGGFAPATGPLTFIVTGPNDQFCGGAPVYTQTVAVNGAGTYDSGSYTPTAAGTYTFRIRYDGDTNNYGVGPTACLDSGASVTVTQDQNSQQAALTNPTNGGVKDTTSPFTWTAGAGAQNYTLWIGTTSGGRDLVNAAVPASTLSYDASILPTGRTLYARLWTMTNGSWLTHEDIAFTASGGAVFTSPSSGQSGFPASALTWSAVPASQRYALWVGTTPGGYDLTAIQLGPATTSYNPILPVGVKLYARVWTMAGGAWVRYHDVSFTAGQGAAFTGLANGQTGVDPNRTITWSGVGGSDNYALWVGTTPGGYDVTAVLLPGTATSYAPASLPSGTRLCARVWTMLGGAWVRYHDVAFTTA